MQYTIHAIRRDNAKPVRPFTVEAPSEDEAARAAGKAHPTFLIERIRLERPGRIEQASEAEEVNEVISPQLPSPVISQGVDGLMYHGAVLTLIAVLLGVLIVMGIIGLNHLSDIVKLLSRRY